MHDELTSILAQLPEPSLPDGFTATVMARIARETDRPHSADVPSTVRRRAEWRGWIWTVAGVALVAGVGWYGWYNTGVPDLTSPRIGVGRMSLLPLQGSALIVGAGLLVYLAGLLAPLRSGRVK